MQARLAELERRSAIDAKDYTWWDESIHRLFEQRDTIWAEDNFGGYAHDNLGWSTDFIIGPDNAPLYAWIEGESFGHARDPLDHFEGGLDRLIEAAREGPMEEPDPATGVLLDADGTPHIVGVSPFTPEYPTVVQLKPAPRALLITSMALDKPALAQIAKASMCAISESCRSARRSTRRCRWGSPPRTDRPSATWSGRSSCPDST